MLVHPDNHPMARGLCFFLIQTLFSTQIHSCIKSDHSSLLSFTLTLSSPSLNWTSRSCCYWEGITCNQVGRVTHLHLPSKGLKLKQGIFNSLSVGNITHLTHATSISLAIHCRVCYITPDSSCL